MIKHLLLKKCLFHFHFILYGKTILKKLISYKKNNIIKEYFISTKKKIIKNTLHSLSNWKKLKILLYKYKIKIFIVSIIKILHKIKKIFYNNNIEYHYNKTTEFKKDNIINNININNYYNNSKCINFNDIQYNNYFNVQIPSKIIKKNKSCEKRKYKKNNISMNRKLNNSTEKRMINIEGEINSNNNIKKEKNMIFTLHSYSLNKNSITFVKNNSSFKLNKIFKIYSKFLGKKQIANNFKKWKEKINERDSNNNNDDKKIINKRIKLNDKLIKMIKNSSNNSQVNNISINDKIMLGYNKRKIYHRKKVLLNIEDTNNSKSTYYNENNKINVISNPCEIISNKENQFFLTERKNSKFNDESKDENKYIKKNVIEEKEIHFIKRKINIEGFPYSDYFI